MSNTNCLEGMQCPQCGAYEPFRIIAVADFTVYDNGTEHFTGVEWEDDARCTCLTCKNFGPVHHFRKEKEEDV